MNDKEKMVDPNEYIVSVASCMCISGGAVLGMTLGGGGVSSGVMGAVIGCGMAVSAGVAYFFFNFA